MLLPLTMLSASKKSLRLDFPPGLRGGAPVPAMRNCEVVYFLATGMPITLRSTSTNCDAQEPMNPLLKGTLIWPNLNQLCPLVSCVSPAPSWTRRWTPPRRLRPLQHPGPPTIFKALRHPGPVFMAVPNVNLYFVRLSVTLGPSSWPSPT